MKVTIYTLTTCPHCKDEINYLTKRGIAYEEKNVEANREYLTEMLQVGNNFAGTPVTKFEKDDGSVVILKGFSAEEFDKELAGVATGATAAAPGAPMPMAPMEPAIPTGPDSALGGSVPSMTTPDMSAPASPAVMPSDMPAVPTIGEVSTAQAVPPTESVSPVAPTLTTDSPMGSAPSMSSASAALDMPPVAPPADTQMPSVPMPEQVPVAAPDLVPASMSVGASDGQASTPMPDAPTPSGPDLPATPPAPTPEPAMPSAPTDAPSTPPAPPMDTPSPIPPSQETQTPTPMPTPTITPEATLNLTQADSSVTDTQSQLNSILTDLAAKANAPATPTAPAPTTDGPAAMHAAPSTTPPATDLK